MVSRSTVFGTVPLYHFARDDTVGRYLAMVDLVRHHDLFANEVADAFDVHRATLHRMLKRFGEQGVLGLVPGKGRRMPTKIKDAVERRLLELKSQGVSNRDVAKRLGLSFRGVEHALRRLQPKPVPTLATPADPVDEQPVLPMEAEGPRVATDAPHARPADTTPTSASAMEAAPETVSNQTSQDQQACLAATLPSVDVDPLNRQGDRLMARLGLLEDAAPMFAPGLVPRGGVLLAIPVLVSSRIFEVAPRVYGSIGPAFYGLRTSILAFLLMALLRVKRAENLKEVAPQELGRVLGLDRAPEMKTLRRKLAELAAQGKGLEFMRLLAHIRAKEHAGDLAYLYIDGHVRVYSGKGLFWKSSGRFQERI